MKVEIGMKVKFTTEEVKEALAEICRQKMQAIYPGFRIDGEFEARADYGYIPPVTVEYEPREEEEAPAPLPETGAMSISSPNINVSIPGVLNVA